MMKKIFRLLLLGFLSVTILSPSFVNATEDQAVQEPKSSIYSEIDSVAPMATPLIQEITLENGESYEFSRKCILFPESFSVGSFAGNFKIRSLSNRPETFSYQAITTVPGINPTIFYCNTSYEENGFGSYNPTYYPESIEEHDFGIRITNYSAGPTAYRFGLSFGYSEDPDYGDFELD
ncbi:hypothetical protein [Enterococcus hulanensis]|uniref:hypothetical protein n=1 Tax=Enterococcus hulanensis TaxID=2559929 RepID=UPI0010F93091|nr:hypothetical protein [Enterococcus hulanensis]